MFHNVVIGKPLVEPEILLSINNDDWENNEKALTLFTNTRFLPAILKQTGIVQTINEVRRNKPEFIVELNQPDFIEVKWGKKKLYIIVGE